MVQIVILALGALCLVIGIMRIASPDKLAEKMAAKDGTPLSDEHRKKAKSNSIALVVMSLVVLGIGAGLTFM